MKKNRAFWILCITILPLLSIFGQRELVGRYGWDVVLASNQTKKLSWDFSFCDKNFLSDFTWYYVRFNSIMELIEEDIGKDLYIVGNESLFDLCGITNLVKEGSIGAYKCWGNKYNPTQQNIKDGNCKE